MSEQEELKKLREIAPWLRSEVDDATLTRLRVRVADRIAQSQAFWDVLALWFRPVALVLGILLLILGITLTQQTALESTDLLARAIPPLEFSLDAD